MCWIISVQAIGFKHASWFSVLLPCFAKICQDSFGHQHWQTRRLGWFQSPPPNVVAKTNKTVRIEPHPLWKNTKPSHEREAHIEQIPDAVTPKKIFRRCKHLTTQRHVLHEQCVPQQGCVWLSMTPSHKSREIMQTAGFRKFQTCLDVLLRSPEPSSEAFVILQVEWVLKLNDMLHRQSYPQ